MFGSGLRWKTWEKRIPSLVGEKKNNKEEENLVSLLKSKLRVSVPVVRARGAAGASGSSAGPMRSAWLPSQIRRLRSPLALLPALITFVYLMIV